MKRLLIILQFVSISIIALGQTGIFQTYIVLESDGNGNAFYHGGFNADGSLNAFNGANLGAPSTLTLNGGEMKTWKSGGGDVFGANLYYTVYEVGQRPSSPAFNQISLSFNENLPNPGDQKWQTLLMNENKINLFEAANGNGTFALEIYWDSPTNQGTNYDGNGGANYIATFTKSTVPVKLESFSASQQESTALLEWKVLSEVNNDFYSVERKVNGQWKNIGDIHSKYGRSSDQMSYQFIDEQPSQGKNVYKLTQTDYDGTTSELGIESVYFQQMDVSVYPNPFIDMINIKLPESQAYQVHIIDMAGKVINNHAFRGDFYQLNLQDTTPGQYHLNLINQNGKPIHSSIITKLR